MAAVFSSPEELRAAVGAEVGPTDWVTIEQSRVDGFADATDDHQWIHVDPVRAAAGPFGGTIAHGYLTLSLVNLFLPQLVRVENAKMGVNYGTDKVRFPAAVRVGARIRGRAQVLGASDVPGGVQITVRVTIEVEGGDRPACVADTISRFFF
ncbi:MAG TPA: MaoC family dehydratase [Steroidobacteraceae bacterium]